MNGGARSRDGPVDTTLYDILNVKPNATEEEIKKVLDDKSFLSRKLYSPAFIFLLEEQISLVAQRTLILYNNIYHRSYEMTLASVCLTFFNLNSRQEKFLEDVSKRIKICRL